RFKKEFTYEKSFDGVLLRFDFRVRGFDRFRARLRTKRPGRRPRRTERSLARKRSKPRTRKSKRSKTPSNDFS
ncbi:MAG: hypothetical protein J6K20_08340, partial [Thermoguttaceae bacterium]|nr:hypothetical protein [Thermoguttaceae bacterium]